MKIITLTCPECGTIIAANVLEKNREMKCPTTDCDMIHKFADLPDTEIEYFLDNIQDYRL
jgi:uncharacterized paraquat-inducible protein A